MDDYLEKLMAAAGSHWVEPHGHNWCVRTTDKIVIIHGDTAAAQAEADRLNREAMRAVLAERDAGVIALLNECVEGLYAITTAITDRDMDEGEAADVRLLAACRNKAERARAALTGEKAND